MRRRSRPPGRSSTTCTKGADVKQADLIWMNGEFVAWEDAQVHVLSHGLHYGTGVFEGIRCYETERGPAIFRHQDHLERLAKSAELYYLPLTYSVDEIRQATHEDRKSTRLNSSHANIYTLSLHDALPISPGRTRRCTCSATACTTAPASSRGSAVMRPSAGRRSFAIKTTWNASPSRPSSTTCRSPTQSMRSARRHTKIGRAHV